ncbi:MAG: amidohydrolase family protein [Actinobacteria bacterium]|nr:amidohydrolase family protein [Actinomycetota bacterium]
MVVSKINNSMSDLVENFNIIDTHFHIGKYVSSFINTDCSDNCLGLVKNLNFKKIIIIHNSFFLSLDTGIKETLNFLSKNKNFAYGYLVYNPHYIEKSINIIEEYYGNNNIIGIKMHPEDHQCFITDIRYEDLWKIAAQKDIPILSHTWNPHVVSKNQRYADALLFEKVVEKYPTLKIILGHAGAKDYYYFEVIKMLKRCRDKNIYIDLAGDIFYRGMIELFVGKLGSEKILFGTDIPWIDPSYTLINVINSDIAAIDKQNIFFNNAARLFNI